MSAPRSRVGDGPRGSRASTVELRPEGLQARQVHVDRPGPEVVAARQREPGAAAAGRAADRAPRSRPASARPGRYGATGSTVGGLVEPQRPGLARPARRAHADRVEQLAHDLDVDDPGHVRAARRCPPRRMLAAISLSTEFLAPPTVTVPVSGPAGRTMIEPIAVSMLARCPGWRRRWSGAEADPDLFRPRRGPRPGGRGRTRSVRPGGGPVPALRAPRCRPRRTARSPRPPATGSPSRGSGGCSPCRLRRSAAARAESPPARRLAAVVGAAAAPRRPVGPRARRCSPRRRSSTGYCNTLFTQTVTFAADEFGACERAQGVAGAVVRVGIIFTIGLLVLADRIGRRRILVVAAVAAPLLAASVRSRRRFVVLTVTQTLARPVAISPRPRGHDRGRRGDAAGEPGLRHQRARPGRRARRRHRASWRSRSPTWGPTAGG